MLNPKKLFAELSFIWKAFRGYQTVFIATTVAGVVGGILGGVGIGTIIPLLAYYTGQNGIAGGKISALIYGIFHVIGITPRPVLLIGFIVVLFIGKAVLTYYTNYFGEKNATEYEEASRKAIFKGLLDSRWKYLLQQKTGHLERVIMDDTNYAGQVLSVSGLLIMALVTLGVYLWFAVTISTTTTVFTLVAGGLIFVFFRGTFSQIQKLAEKVIDTEKEVNHHVGENLSGAKTLKSLASEQGAVAKVSKEFADITALRLKILKQKLVSGSYFEPISFAFIGVIFLLSYKVPGFEFGSFAAAIYLIQKVFSYFQTIQSYLQNIIRYMPSLRSVARYREAIGAEAEENPGSDTFSFTNALEFRSVSFRHGEKGILKDVSFRVKKGGTVGIIGASGSGKTTLADLLLRLFEAETGSIKIDDKDIRCISLKAWRKSVGYVSQDVFLLNDTVENNIRFYDETIDAEAVAHAAKLANVFDTIESLPEKFKTVVGERGVKLSGGQRQRIALARVLARNPQILILDEATSALDNESERAIQKTLETIRGTVTVVAIAHRISTVQNADAIVALEKGTIIEQGAPEELMRNANSYFRKMSALGSDAPER